MRPGASQLMNAVVLASLSCTSIPPASPPRHVSPSATEETADAPPPLPANDPAPRAEPVPEPAPEPAPPALDAEVLAALDARLRTEPLEGYAMVWDDAVLFTRAEEARAAAARTAEGKSAKAVRIVRDHGEVVEVRTWVEGDAFPEAERFMELDLTLFARRNQLIPVLRVPIKQDHEDGSGYVLDAGTTVSVGPHIQPRDALVALSGAVVAPEHVGRAFAPADRPALRALGMELSCEWSPPFDDRARPDLMSRKRMLERIADEWREQGRATPPREVAFAVDSVAGCRVQPGGLGRIGATSVVLPGTLTSLSRGHHPTRSATGDDRVVVDFTPVRALLRMAIDVDQLRRVPCCGGFASVKPGGLRFLGMKDARVVVGEKAVFFSDGRRAGKHRGAVHVLTDPAPQRGRICAAHPRISQPLCFRPRDVQTMHPRDVDRLRRP